MQPNDSVSSKTTGWQAAAGESVMRTAYLSMDSICAAVWAPIDPEHADTSEFVIDQIVDELAILRAASAVSPAAVALIDRIRHDCDRFSDVQADAFHAGWIEPKSE